jgi:hypothetical protein
MPSTLKDSLYEVVHNPTKPIKVLADELGISYSYLANAANPNLEDFNFQLRHLIPLIKSTGNFAVLDFIENALGRVALSLPKADPTVPEIHSSLFRSIESFGVLAKHAAAAVDDGKITRKEFVQLDRDGFDLIKRVVLFLHNVQAAAR